MSIDLTKLIAKRSYLVPIKASDLCDKLLEQLKLDDASWIIDTKHPRSAVLNILWRKKFVVQVLAQEGKLLSEENVAAKEKEFDANVFVNIKAIMEALVGNKAVEVTYIVKEERADGCKIETTCKPLVYLRVVRGFEHLESEEQDAKVRCEEFLDEIFIGGLEGKEIQEVKEVSRWELLINNTHVRQITERIYEMLSKATTCVLFFGWFGTEFVPKFKELKDAGLTIRAITHKPSERKAPVPEELQKGYTELIGLLGLNNVSINPLVHGRAMIVDNKALVGSMDLNAFSVSGEHIEFAIYTEDPSAVRSLRAYFEKIFKPLKETSVQGA
jgi:phosphatidylserine/phosphatidylglycerophosphate/cardiolipin synthase-like enzyme